MEASPSISLLCHLYYKDSLPLLLPFLTNFNQTTTRFYFNICSDSSYRHEVLKNIYADFPQAIVTASPNVGKDIGGKLVLLDTYLKLEMRSTYLVLLHDKMSPHTGTGTTWRNKLLSILEPQNIASILHLFKTTNDVGLIATNRLLLNEYDPKTKAYTCSSNQQLWQLRQTYGITATNHQFVGGTMFWVRAALFEDFFAAHAPLTIRHSLEKGNVLDHQQGTFSHAWERMFSWIVLNAGFQIKGI